MNRNIWNDLISLFYPKVCLTCQQFLVTSEVFICTNCLVQLTDNQEYYALLDKFVSFPIVDFASSYLSFKTKGPVQKLIHAIKYESNQELAIFLGKVMARQMKLNEHQYDMILPVPLHAKRLKERGYNQSELLAFGFGKISGLRVVTDQIVRQKATTSQTKKSKIARWENTRGIYAISPSACLADQRILLLDDVITTGATLSGIVELLTAENVKSVGILSLASEK